MKYTKVNYEYLLPKVDKPSRYIGYELNAINKKVTDKTINFCLAFPDVYEVGLSHLGIKILYTILNNEDNTVCDRTYAPWPDFTKLMKENEIPLFSLENKIPVKDFDVIGFTLQSELNFSNVPYMLDLAGIELEAKDRGEDDPIILGGGPAISNPAPLSLFFDAIFIGEAEDAIVEIKDCLFKLKDASRQEKLEALGKIEGVYVPLIHDDSDEIKIRKYSGFSSYEKSHVNQLIPWQQTTHDRYIAEIMRGCSRGCRFCHAGFFYRPVRERNPDEIIERIIDEVEKYGWEDAALTSLSSSDYSQIRGLLFNIFKRLNEHRADISLPSLRVDTLDDNLTALLNVLGQKGLTIAPEAGTQRLRDVINKNLSEEEILEGVRVALANDWRSIKLYFMIGLPFETREDVEGIVELVEKMISISGKKIQLNITLSPFVPKPFTPFQWSGMLDKEELFQRVSIVKNALYKYKYIKVRYHELQSSMLETILAKGDKRIGYVMKEAFKLGAKFDGWREYFNFDIWEQALETVGLQLEDTMKGYALDDKLPWDNISIKVTKDFLKSEWLKAKEEQTTPSCIDRCTGCGVCDNETKLDFSTVEMTEVIENLKREEPDNNIELFWYRVFFKKQGGLQYVAHLDFLRMIHRILRGTSLNLAYSQGYSPHPKVRFGPPLSVGVQGINEFMEVAFYQKYSPETVLESLGRLMKGDLAVNRVIALDKRNKSTIEESGQELIQITPNEDCKVDFEKIIESYDNTESFIFEKLRKKKIREVDLKKIISRMEWNGKSLLIQKKLQGASLFDILEYLFKISRNETSSFIIIRLDFIF